MMNVLDDWFTWVRRWQRNRDSVANFLSQSPHWCFFSSEWIDACAFSLCFVANRTPHIEHRNLKQAISNVGLIEIAKCGLPKAFVLTFVYGILYELYSPSHWEILCSIQCNCISFLHAAIACLLRGLIEVGILLHVNEHCRVLYQR